MPTIILGFVAHALLAQLLALCHVTYGVFVETPLRALYYSGPLLHGYGFWGGTPLEEVCATLMPGTSGLFWLQHVSQCKEVVETRFRAFLTAASMLIYALVVYKLFAAACFYFFVCRPLLRTPALTSHYQRCYCLEQQATDTEEHYG